MIYMRSCNKSPNSDQEEDMSRIKSPYYFVIVVLLLASIACSISATPKKTPQESSGGQQAGSTQGGSTQGGSQPSQTENKVPAIFEKAPTTPIGLNKGLSSLNSYTYSLQILTTGPTPQDKNDMKIITSYTSNDDSTKTQNISVSSSADAPEESRSSSTNYRVGSVTCTIDDTGESEAEIDEFPPSQKEILYIATNLTDTVINVENPVSVGTETINGINCNHYTFKVVGLGKTSGAEVTQSTGEYWSAVDGNYLVKYDVSLETRDAPENNPNAEVLHTEMHFLLSDINAAITIQLPAECNKP
jgi:hypothetical protein